MRSVLLITLLAGCAIDDGVDSIEAAISSDTGDGTDALLYAGILANTTNNRLFAANGLSQLIPTDLRDVDRFDFYKIAITDPLSRDVLQLWAGCALATGHTMTIPQGTDSA